jgi:threonylcarbamoyladenosine tRNA methylthiotransferase MtaB
MKKIRITTLGCKVNQYESASFQSSFAEAGCEMIAADGTADLVVINTCAVTAKAGAQSRQAIRHALHANPMARLIITGCYAEAASEELLDMPELAGRSFSIIGNAAKQLVVETALQEGEVPERQMADIMAATEICRLPVDRFGDKTRAFLRVQDGCDSYCTYCIVPFTRGPSRSLPADEVVRQAAIFAEAGHKEIVVTGIHLGHYGRDLAGGPDIAGLLDLLSAALPAMRYRISSLEPLEITEGLLQLIADRDNLMPHLHIPLQAGDDEILQWMNRRYGTARFAEIIALCRRHLPDAAIGIDVMVGFPGETEAHFQRTSDFIAGLDCTYLHVFPYSDRPGTRAATFRGKVAKVEKARRVASLLTVAEEKKTAFHRHQLQRRLPVLVESQRGPDGLLRGFTDNYVPVRFPGPDSLMDSIVTVELLALHDTTVIGEVRER